MKGIGILVIAGLVIWWLSRSKQAKATELLPGETYSTEPESEYEKLHKTVPITEYVTKQISVYNSIEEWEEVHG